ncbi:hypothetical protein [Streptomyces sp. NBC_00448]|uniref:hypothetical protein n=1 Tax=Streptomyces sp. NBC_00448 TaxID=2903652 RepID=UPI002E218F57
MRVGLSRWRVAVTAVLVAAVVAACGGGGGGSKDDPTPTPDPPVSLKLQALDTYARGTDGLLALSMHTNGAHPPKVKVALRFDVPAGKSLKTRYEPVGSTGWDGWPTLKLARSAGPEAGLDTLTGSYTVPIKDEDIWRLYLNPQYGPSGADDAVAVHATLSSAGRTLASDSVKAPLAALTVAALDVKGTTLHRDGRWTEATYAVHNVSTRDIAQVDAGLSISPCSADDVVSCDPTGADAADDFTMQQDDGHRWVAVTRSANAVGHVLSTSLKAGASARVRVRVAAAAGLGKDVTRVDISLAAGGKMPGAKTSSYDSAARTFDIAR